MPETETVAISLEVMPSSEPYHGLNGNGAEMVTATRRRATYTPHSTLAELPGHSTTFSVDTLGEKLGQMFTEHPDWPGAILFDDKNFVGVISQSHFYKCVSRAFGREVYYRRPASIMLDESTAQTLILPSECPIQAAVEKCLTRPIEYIYEPFLIHDQESGEYRLCALQILLLASSQLASLRNRQMEQILNSVTDGLLVIDRNLRIGGEYSKVVEHIFERKDLRNASLPEVLHPLLDKVTYENLQDYLRILFDPKLIDRLIKSINPAKQISLRFTSDDSDQGNRVKHFALNFERIRAQKEISQVLVRVEDITQRINMAKELEQQEAAAEEKLQLIMQLLQVEPGVLNRYLSRYNEEVAAMENLLGTAHAGSDPRETIHTLFRKAHTLKGEAAVLQLTAHERYLHQAEDQLEKLRALPQPGAGDLRSLQPSIDVLKKLGEQVRMALDQLRHLDTSNRQPALEASAPAQIRGDGLIETVTRIIKDTSERLGKPATFHTSIKDEDLPEKHREVLNEVLIHLARNSMVHGIEGAALRSARGKSPTGVIQLELKPHPDCYEMIFQDDGGGLDYGKIRERAQQMGWNLSSEQELREVIFEPGFSTADNVTELAGRGVGLDAIRHVLQEVRGEIFIHSQQGIYCAFQILLPLNIT